MLQDECDLDDDEEEEYDSVDMNIVKQMIGLKINDGENQNQHNRSEEEVKSSNILLSTNRMYDFKQPSSKVSCAADEILKNLSNFLHDRISPIFWDWFS